MTGELRKLILAKPDLLTTEYYKCVVGAKSLWSDASTITHITFDCKGFGEKIITQLRKTILPGDNTRVYSIRKNQNILAVPDMEIGNIFDEKLARKFRTGMQYIKSEWVKTTNKSGFLFLIEETLNSSQISSSAASNTITVTGAGWGVNVYQYKWVLYNDEYYYVASNTSDTLTLDRTHGLSGVFTFEIKDIVEIGDAIEDTSSPYNSDGWTIFLNGVGFKRPKYSLETFQMTVDNAYNLSCKNIGLIMGTK